MRNYTFDFELETMFTMLISVFEDIIVKRYNRDKVPEEQIKVRFVYAPKQRVLLDLVDKAHTIQLPVVSLSNGGIRRDTTRVFNKIVGSYLPNEDPRYANNLLQPIPVDVTVNMSILTRYQKDFDQIITNIFPYFDPYITISWRTPSMPDEEIRSTVQWSGDITTVYPTDLDANKIARVQGDTTLTIKGWLFKAPSHDGNIFTITTDYNLTKELTTKYSLEQLDTTLTDRFVISAIPQPKSVTPYTIQALGSNIPYVVNGTSFFNITSVYLSGNTGFNNTLFNPFSSFKTLSAENPAFYAIKLPLSSYAVVSDTELAFIMPEVGESGYIDVIIQNGAGYGKLTTYAQKSTANPILASNTFYKYWIPIQPPFLSGIIVTHTIPPSSDYIVTYTGQILEYNNSILNYNNVI